MQLRVLRFRSDENRNVRVGVFPKREEILIGRLGLGGVALHGIGSADLEMRECADGFVEHNSTMVEDFLELGCGFAALDGRLDRLGRAHRLDTEDVNRHRGRLSQLVRSGGLKSLDSFAEVIAVERKLRSQCRQVIELDESVLRKLFAQIIGQRCCPDCIACQGQRQGRPILDIPSRRKRQAAARSIAAPHRHFRISASLRAAFA